MFVGGGQFSIPSVQLACPGRDYIILQIVTPNHRSRALTISAAALMRLSIGKLKSRNVKALLVQLGIVGQRIMSKLDPICRSCILRYAAYLISEVAENVVCRNQHVKRRRPAQFVRLRLAKPSGLRTNPIFAFRRMEESNNI